MTFCHITDTTWNPRPLPSRFGEISENYQNSDPAIILRDGWRVAVSAVVEAGARYTSAVVFTDTEAREIATVTATAAQVAAELAAAEAARLETPLVFDQPVQARFEIVAHDAHVYGLEIDPTAGEVIPVQRESTRLTQAEYVAARAARLAERETHRQRIAGIEADCTSIDTAVDNLMALDLSATGTLGVAIAATTGVNKTALTAMRQALIDVRAKVKTIGNNARQACEKIRREIR